MGEGRSGDADGSAEALEIRCCDFVEQSRLRLQSKIAEVWVVEGAGAQGPKEEAVR